MRFSLLTAALSVLTSFVVVSACFDSSSPNVAGSGDGGGGGGAGENDGSVTSQADGAPTGQAGDASSGSDADAAKGAPTIASTRQAPPADGAAVALHHVVVVAHVTSKKAGQVWVQDQGGGPYSGILLSCNYGGTSPNCSMTQAQIDALAVGAVVDVSGAFASALPVGAPMGAQPSLRIDAPVITTTGQSSMPVAVSVTAATIDKTQLASVGARPYEGAYVQVNGASFPVSTVTATDLTAACTDKSLPPQTGTTYTGFEVTNAGATIAVGLGFYNTVTYCLPCGGVALPYPCSNPVIVGEMFTSLRGIVEPAYNANGQVYLQVSPITDTDAPHS